MKGGNACFVVTALSIVVQQPAATTAEVAPLAICAILVEFT
jgi:hypothetical protein